MKSRLTTIWILCKRNIRLFVRDRASLFFSFLSPIILLFLYLFFLADLQVDNIEFALKQVPNLVYTSKDIRVFVYSWLLANVVSLSIITVTLGVSGNVVLDKEKGVIKDFSVAPVSKFEIVISYFLSLFIVSLTINLLLIVLGQLYLLSIGGELLPLIDLLKFLGVLVISLFSVVLLIMIVVSYLETSNSYSALSAIVGTFAGFLIGAYMPISLFPKWVQLISNIIPASLSSALLRNIMMEGTLANLLKNVPQEFYNQIEGNIRYNFSMDLFYYDYKIESWLMLLIVGGSVFLFLLINIFRYSKKKI